MNVLEKILGDIIDELKEEGIIIDDEIGHRAVEIIRSHMDDLSCEKDMKITRSSRDNGGWTPVEEGLPEEPVFGEDSYIVQHECIIKPYTAYWNGENWIDDYDEPIKGIVAWQPLPESYKPNKLEKKHKNTQQEMEDFWRDK